MVTMRVLVDDRIESCEHGLSILVNTKEDKWLFDTGQSDQFIKKLKSLSINISDLKGIIISHGHYDHANGLTYIGENIPVYLHKDSLVEKYKRIDDNYYFNGISSEVKEKVGECFSFVDGLEKMSENIFVLANNPVNANKHNFYIKDKIWVKDDFRDEILLIVRSSDYLTVFTGCAHFDLVKSLEKLSEHFPKYSIKYLIGGLHLKDSTEEKIHQIIDGLIKLRVENVILLHCTGDTAINILKERYKSNCFIVNSSDEFLLT